MDDKEIKFVASRYRKDAFSPEKAWRSMNIAPRRWWHIDRIAAAVAGLVFLGAAAAIIFQHSAPVAETPAPIPSVTDQQQTPAGIVSAIDFDNAPLTDVIAEIEKVYGVKVADIPADAASYNISLHYEGNVYDLIDRINEILDTNLEIRQ